MKCGTRSLAVLGALALSAMGLVPGAWAVDGDRADSAQSAHVDAAQSGEERPGLADMPIADIQAVGAGDDSAMVGPP